VARFEASQAAVPQLIVLDQVGSTNDELASRASSGALPPFTTLVTTDQTAGRGRRDRVWSTPPGRGLAISVLLPAVPATRIGWVPLAAGLAMRDSIAALLGDGAASVKWPNDVLIGGRKVSGVLGRVSGSTTVLGAGLNVRLAQDELPIPDATSLVLAGAEDHADLDDSVLAAYLTRLRMHVERLVQDDPIDSGLQAAVVAACETLGRRVRIELPNAPDLEGVAVDIAPDARLVVRTDRGVLHPIAAGDVSHLRPGS
jgi:BirA family transcriptional regulator, biotin operon repressor / biotin---[acetyl-CoA-carboxylase] ligase